MAGIELPYNQLLNWAIARGKVRILIYFICYKIPFTDVKRSCLECFGNNEEFPESVKPLCTTTHDESVDLYELVQKVVDMLKQTDKGKQLNLFGQYTFVPLYNLNKLLNNIHRYNLHIVYYCQRLHHNVTYEAPFLRNSIERVGKELADCKSQIADSVRKYNSMYSELKQKLKYYHIELDDFPCKIEYKDSLFSRVEECIISDAVEHITKSWNESFLLIKKLYPDVTMIFNTYVDMHGIQNLYNNNSFRYFCHASQKALHNGVVINNEKPELIELKETNTATDMANDNRDANVEGFTESKEKSEHCINIMMDNEIAIPKENYDLIFNSFLSKPLYRQLLLADLREIMTFVEVRISQSDEESESLICMFMELDPKYQKVLTTPKSKVFKIIVIVYSSAVYGGQEGS
ncbi:CDK5 regulatory subunit-associated protein 3 [Babesia duncani]|uniref:CDK5 regulatory subunit-associated protein 3 n=1 Tax=Babesia duncani TaxID=323732 RepID=A0AAD9UND8_9APIC|nr:CDK5 regulatory subunit-associated protein 3 [Babesia duncani]